MKRNYLIVLSFLLACSTNKGPVHIASMAVPVQVQKVQHRVVREVLETGGIVKGIREVRVWPETPGRLEKILVKEGDRVKKGEVLAVLETAQSQARLSQALAALDAARAQFVRAKGEFSRVKELFSKGAATRQQLDTVRAALEAARAGVRQAEAGVRLARKLAAETVVKAPFDGVVTASFFEVGDLVNPGVPSLSPSGPDSLIRIAQVDKVRVIIRVPDKALSWVKKGIEGEVRSDAWPHKIFKGKVTKVNPGADPFTRTFKVELTLNNPDFLLRPQMFVMVKLIKRQEQGLAVPQKAVVKRNSRDVVFVVHGKQVKEVPIKVGLSGEGWSLVLQGLKGTEDVVVAGNAALKDGSLVLVEAAQ